MRRTSARARSAFYALGVYVGGMLGFMIGAPVAEAWGWRSAFFIVGLPGLLIAALIYFTVRSRSAVCPTAPPRRCASCSRSARRWRSLARGLRVHLEVEGVPSRRDRADADVVRRLRRGDVGGAFLEAHARHFRARDRPDPGPDRRHARRGGRAVGRLSRRPAVAQGHAVERVGDRGGEVHRGAA